MSPADPGYLTDAQVIRFTFRWHCQKNQIITQPADQTKPVHLIKPEKITQHCSVWDTSVWGTENLWHLCGDNMRRIELKMWWVVNKTESFTCTFFKKLRTAIGFVLYYLWKWRFTVFLMTKFQKREMSGGVAFPGKWFSKSSVLKAKTLLEVFLYKKALYNKMYKKI